VTGVGDCCSAKGYRTIFNEDSARRAVRRYRKRGLDGPSRRIVEILRQRGVEGRTVLEVGGGIGEVEIELLKAGAASALNVELTPTYEGAARELLNELGLDGRAERRVMDFVAAAPSLDVADIVVMNRVVCCYPDLPALAGAAAAHAASTLVMSFPNARPWTRLTLMAANFGFWVMRVQFRIFAHPPGRILATAEAQGMTTRVNQAGFFWQVAALERPA
jgi:magnesium-protoporphyrin O-methyltransferase